MASEEVRSVDRENFEWNVDNEIRLFEAMIGHKPVGINKHFHMACISEKFESLIGKPVSSDFIWQHLETMYDLVALDKKESLPFPNEVEEFCLPETEYLDLINEKLSLKTENFYDLKDNKEGRTTPKSVKDYTSMKDSIKKEKKSDTDETMVDIDAEKKDGLDSESDGKKAKANKDEKIVKTRGKRSLKDKKGDEDLNQTSINKKEDSISSILSAAKKDKQIIGKRSLRSRADDSHPTKSVTPPPKRPRRI